MFGIISRIRRIRREISKTFALSRDINTRTKAISREIRKLDGGGRVKASRRSPPIEFSKLPGGRLICPVCSEQEIEWVSAYPSASQRFRMAIVLYCSQCGSGHVPDADRILDGYYEDEYAATNRGDRYIDPEAYFSSIKTRKIERYFSRAKHQVDALRRHGAVFGDVLDYGSGPGYFLRECSPARPYAVEPDASSRKYLEYLGAKCISDDQISSEQFDVVLASHVIEHLTVLTLDKTLAKLASALRRGGLILIEVPTGAHTYLVSTKMQEPHTLFFTPDGIRIAVARSGLEILDCYARADEGAAPRESPVYHPDQTDVFSRSTNGGLTVIARRR